MRILIVEDDQRIADFLVRAMKTEGYSCVHSSDGKEGLELSRKGDFDLILLDLMLPTLSGLDICQELRMRNILTPIIMLTAMDDVEDRIKGLKMGADDYMTKPFIIDELFARLEAVVRRGHGSKEINHVLEVGDIIMDKKKMIVTLKDKPITVTAKEFAVLELLMTHPGRIFSRERILSNIWGMDKDPLTNVVDVYIGKLRKKFSGDNSTNNIETIRGMGYRITADE